MTRLLLKKKLYFLGKPKSPSSIQFNGDCSNATGNVRLAWEQQNYYGHQISYYTLEYASSDSDDEDQWVLYDADSEITGKSVLIPVDKLPASADLKFRIKGVMAEVGEKYVSDGVVFKPDPKCVTPGGGKNAKNG